MSERSEGESDPVQHGVSPIIAPHACQEARRSQIGLISSDADGPAPRTFTDAEVRGIFAAATDREAEADRAGATAPSAPDLEELKRIGAEAGIAPEHVEAAARSVIRRPPGELPVPAAELGVSTARR